MIYFCAMKQRRTLVLASALNGIDYLEASADGKHLTLVLLKAPTTAMPAPAATQVFISGGETITGITVTGIAPVSGQPLALTITLDETGDYAPYTLSLQASATTTAPPPQFDPALSSVVFRFHAGFDASVDCQNVVCCPPTLAAEPDINYLAKDFPAFQQVMLDRLAVLVPSWNEPHAADIGNTLVEILAYAADHLSYRQDAVATEAYLGTARSRISLRRHARLVDYTVNEGSNACTFVHFDLRDTRTAALPQGTPIQVPQGTTILPRVIGVLAQIDPSSSQFATLALASPAVFATMAAATLVPEQNVMPFYTWSDEACCLPAGATSATLAGSFTSLAANTVLLFEEVLGPDTGVPGDADPSHRWAVRLVSASVGTDPLNNQPIPITNIAWDPADALPFTLCITSSAEAAAGMAISVARGNMVPADHGQTQGPEILGPVPAPPPTPIAIGGAGCGGATAAPVAPPPFFFPSLAASPLTFARSYNPSQPASSLAASPVAATITLTDNLNATWSLESDLLTSGESDMDFVAEIENDGTAWLRFGDGTYGQAPAQGQTFAARYRSGNGSAGNVGADTLGIVGLAPSSLPPPITGVRNPIAATGGVDGDNMATIRTLAPFAFRTQLRAVTEADYAAVALRDTRIADARGTLRWTGSWRTAFVTIDPASNAPANLATATQATLETMRMAGTDVVVEGASLVGLYISLLVTVAPSYQRTAVRQALSAVFSTGLQPNGQPGLLDPAQFTFGASVYLSPFIAAAQDIDGVAAVQCQAFQRVDSPQTDYAAQGAIPLARLEIARVDNDPNRPDLGSLTIDMEGGW